MPSAHNCARPASVRKGIGASEQVPPLPVTEDPFDELLAHGRVMKPVLVFDRNEGKVLHERAGEEPRSVALDRSAFRIHRHAADAATGGAGLEDVAAQVQGFQFPESSLGESHHRARVVHAGRDRNKARRPSTALQPEPLARHTESHLDFRTDRHPFDQPAEGPGQQGIPLMAAVVADSVPAQALADSNPERSRGSHGAEGAASAGWCQEAIPVASLQFDTPESAHLEWRSIYERSVPQSLPPAAG